MFNTIPKVVFLKRFFPWLCVVLWMILIFSLSAQPATQSAQVSGSWTKKIMGKVYPQYTKMALHDQEQLLLQTENIFRKGAHAFLYFILAALLLVALQTHLQRRQQLLLLALSCCLLYSCFDEIHQYFVPGRGPSMFDVLIDMMGAIFAGGCYALWQVRGRRLKKDRMVKNP